MNSPGKVIRSRGAANCIGSREDMPASGRGPSMGQFFPDADAAAIQDRAA